VKPILVLFTVVFALGLAIPPLAAGQQATQTKELRLTAEQLGEEIAAWQKQLDALEDDIQDPANIWVKLEAGYVFKMEEAEIMGQIKRLWLLDFLFESVLDKNLGFERAMWPEQRIIVEMDAAVKVIYTELMRQDRAIREEKEQQAVRLREIIRTLEKKRADALAARSQQAGTPTFKPDEAAVTISEIEAAKNELEPTRLAEQWDLRDHGYVISYLDRKVKTPFQLRLVKQLTKDISTCYQAWHAENARIEAAAKAGGWIPGKRIGARSQAQIDRDERLRRIKASFEAAWQAP
jgi:hypothetical protein